MISLLENNIRDGVRSVMGDRYVVSDGDKEKIDVDSNKLYGHSMSQMLTYDEIKFDKNGEL